MVYCKCGLIYIDGGNEYQCYGWPGGEVMIGLILVIQNIKTGFLKSKEQAFVDLVLALWSDRNCLGRFLIRTGITQ